ncbi:MAG: hypothetical protein M5U28_09990 [Sandaracinaceae bacterium]|nr:hypothetical protein [Sandaracinaceae bacterium]
MLVFGGHDQRHRAHALGREAGDALADAQAHLIDGPAREAHVAARITSSSSSGGASRT